MKSQQQDGLPRGNQSIEDLRRAYRELTPGERLVRAFALSKFASRLRAAGRRARRG